ncbi:MAG: hypothetical protein ACT4PZ_01120 [Panacagrimonas sp.]
MQDHNDDPHLAEQFPLAPIDDHFIHQTPDPVRVVASTDPRFFERHWNVFHDDKGELLIATGGSFYPNLDIAEAYAIVNHRGMHRSVRAFRPLGVDRMNLHVGPIRPTIVSGLRTWRHMLLDNDQGISFDLEWRDTKRQVYHAAYGSIEHGRPRGGQRHVTAGFEGFGEVSGWVQVGDERIELHRAKGTRDRHWGIGRGVGGPAMQPGGRPVAAGWIGGNWICFKEFGIWGNVVLYNYGDARRGMGKVLKTERRLRFEPDTQIFLAGEIDYTLSDGQIKRVQFERLGVQTAYMRCGLYGGTPVEGRHHGTFVGNELLVESDCYDVNQPEHRRLLRGLNEHHCRIRCDGEETTGILQPLEPDAYEACVRGDPGWSLLD